MNREECLFIQMASILPQLPGSTGVAAVPAGIFARWQGGWSRYEAFLPGLVTEDTPMHYLSGMAAGTLRAWPGIPPGAV